MKKKTHIEFVSELETTNPNVFVLGKYISNKTKIKVECKICGNIWLARPIELLNGSGCNECAIKARRKSHSEFIKELNNVNQNIEVLSEYNNFHSDVVCKCKIDGHIWTAHPSNLLNGHGCPKCSGKYNRTHNEFIAEMNIVNPEIEILSEFKNVYTRVKCKCKTDGHIWSTFPNALLRGSGCKVCNESKGEKKIKTYLKNNNIYFEGQKTYEGLIGLRNGLLSYDFYVPDYNILIEYQGEFHDGTVKYQSEKDYQVQIEHDKRKKEYARLNNIELLEIWYWDFNNIDDILSLKFDELKRKEVA